MVPEQATGVGPSHAAVDHLVERPVSTHRHDVSIPRSTGVLRQALAVTHLLRVDNLGPGCGRSSDQPAPDTPQEIDGGDASSKQPRSGTKLEQFIQLLRRPEGVSIKEAAQALDWMEHSVRGAVAGALKKKYGLTITAAKVEGRGTVYTVAN